VLYPVRAGGKRVRPALAILSCLASGGREEQAYPAAIAVELVHNYSLILDDIIDHSELRRGKPTLWKKYGLSTAILVAVHYRETVSEVLNDSPNPRLFHEVIARAVKLLVDGERLDILFEQAGREDEPYVIQHRRRAVSLDEYIRMVERKTAALIQAACELGALSAGAPLAEVLAKSVVTPEDVARAIDLIRRTSARQRAEELRNRYVERALAALERLPGSPYRDFLRDLAIFIKEREF
jgi:geranylgeranyl diphosphate synthase type I